MATFTDDFAGTGALSANWSLINGSGVARVSDQARTTTGNGRDQVMWVAACDTLDQFSQVDMDCDNGEITPCILRSTATYSFPWTDGYSLFYWPAYTEMWLRKNTGGGAGSDLTSVALGDLTGMHTFRLEAEDVGGSTELRAFVDDMVTPVLTYTDATPLTGMRVGFGWGFFSSDTMRGIADNFEAGDLGGGVPEEKSTVGTIAVSLASLGAASKTAAAAGALSLGLVVGDDAAKTGVTAGGVALAVGVAGQAGKLAAVLGQVAVSLGLAGDVSGESEVKAATGAITLSTFIEAVAAKDADAAGALLLALSVAGDTAKLGQVAGSLGIDLDASGTVDASADDSTVGAIGLALALVATAAKVSGTAGQVPLVLGVDAAASKTAFTVGSLSLTLALAGRVGDLAGVLGRFNSRDVEALRINGRTVVAARINGRDVPVPV